MRLSCRFRLPLLPLATLHAALLLAGCQALTPKTASEPALVPEPGVEDSVRADSSEPLDAEALLPPVEGDDQPPVSNTEAPDLLARIRDKLSFEVPDHPAIVAEREWFLRNQDFVARAMGRGSRYLHHIVTVFEERGLPVELALLPVVESAFQPFAYSPSRAAGIWQFVPITAKNFGLKQTWWQDSRRCVIQSTDAAARLLTKLHDIFDGDWLLAVAAYNGGDGYLKRRMSAQRKAGKATDFWSLDLRSETTVYVPKLLALVQLLREPEKYGMQWPAVPDTPYFERVEVGSQIDMSVAAELSGVPEEELYQLNPAYVRWATDPIGPHYLLVPTDAAEGFRQALAETPPEQRLRWAHYTVRAGDTVASVAKKHHIDSELLKRANQLKGNSLKADSQLLIPRAADSKAPALVAAPLTVLARRHLAAAEAVASSTATGSHTVKSGDSPWTISRQYRMPLKELLAMNGLHSGSKLKPGQVLKIAASDKTAAGSDKAGSKPPGEKTLASRTATAKTADNSGISGKGADKAGARSSKQLAGDETRKKIDYRIRSGDSLYRISERFNVKVTDLQRWNRKLGKTLRPGDNLVIYVEIDNAIGG